MTTLGAVDPGVWHLGVATFDDGQLVNVALEHAPTKTQGVEASIRYFSKLLRGRFDELVIEQPRIYRTKYQKGDQNDLIDLALVVGGLVASFPRVKLVLPSRWKGQVPKKVMQRRCRDLLTAEEVELINADYVRDHNKWDAIGIGLWRLGRL